MINFRTLILYINLMIVSFLGHLEAADPLGISPLMVSQARNIYTLEIEAYTKRGVHPAYALAAILRNEGGLENARMAAAILETGVGIGGINTARKANALETAIARLTAFSLGANYGGHLFANRAPGEAARHQSELREFFERGKGVFVEEKEITMAFFEDTEDDKLLGAQDTPQEKYENFWIDERIFVKKKTIYN